MASAAAGKEGRIRRLERSLEQHLEFEWERLTPFREGVDGWVDLLELKDGTRLALKSPKWEVQHTRYEGIVTFGTELPRQLAAAELMEAGGVPTPRIRTHHARTAETDDPSWLAMDFVEHEEGDWQDPALQERLGALTRRIHSVHPPADEARAAGLIERGGTAWSEWIVERILKRLDAARTYVELPDETAVRERLAATAKERDSEACSLLHLDLRPPNIAVREGRIVSLFDLGNAIVGDPCLELARIRSAGLLTPDFLKGYGLPSSELEAHSALLDAYELDVAALLVVVSSEEFDDPVLHARMAARTRHLLHRLGLIL